MSKRTRLSNYSLSWLGEPSGGTYNFSFDTYNLADYQSVLNDKDGNKRQSPLFIGTELGITVFGSGLGNKGRNWIGPHYLGSAFFGIKMTVNDKLRDGGDPYSINPWDW